MLGLIGSGLLRGKGIARDRRVNHTSLDQLEEASPAGLHVCLSIVSTLEGFTE